jgi:hypothetical protein
MRPSSLVPLIAAALLVFSFAPARGADCPSAVTFIPAETGSSADTGWTGLAIGRPIFQLRNRTSGLCWGASYAAPFQKATETDLKVRD